MKRTYVIEQDQHLQNLRKIIKRDFFGSCTPQEEEDTINMTLDRYISNYKSNENHLFSEMVHVNNQEWKQKHWWIDKQDKMLMISDSQKYKALPYHNMLAKNNQINGIDTSIVKQDAQNSFFFNRDQNYGSLQAKEHHQQKKVVYKNCKLDDALVRMRAELAVKYQEITPARQKTQRNVNKVLESRQVNEDDGQLMTWGQIESTPMRLAGPQFKIPQTPQRQQILNHLNNKISKQKLQGGKKSEHAMKILGTLTPSYNSTRKKMISSIRRIDSVKREGQNQRNDLSGLLNIKKI